MSAEEDFAKANALYVDERFEEAAPFYDNAIKKEPTNPSFYLHRAANQLKLGKHTEALSDTESCLKQVPTNHLAHLRRGMALFNLDRFTEAKAAFEEAARLGNTNTKLWLRKCDAELADAAAAAAPAAPAPAPVESKAPTPAVAAPAPAPAPAPAAGAGAGVELASKVRESWYQNVQSVGVTLFAKGVPKDKVKCNFGEKTLSVEAEMPDKSVFSKSWKLFSAVVPDASTFTVTPYKIEITLKKASVLDWDSLEEKAEAVEAVKRANIHDGSTHRYPSSSLKGKDVDWQGLAKQAEEEEEKEPVSGDAALQKLFQKIYRDADEDTRRAMMKSYQTSGGTVLSTNWKEVAQKDYEKERKPPKGQEYWDPNQ